jgi:hypothetical protein
VIDVVICHAAADSNLAERIAARLRITAEANIWCDQLANHQTVVDVWGAGLSMSAVLLVISPHSVPRQLNRADWEELIAYRIGNQVPPVGILVAEDCKYPKLLDRGRVFRWQEENSTSLLREMQQWLISLHKGAGRLDLASCALPPDRAAEVDELWGKLVDQPGVQILRGAPGSGKTALAQWFARQARGHFRDTIWVDCAGRGHAWMVEEVAGQLGSQGECTGWAEVCRMAAAHRLLLVLDDVAVAPGLDGLYGGRASAIVTVSNGQLAGGSEIAQPAPGPDGTLWQAMAVCRRNGFPFEFAARIAELETEEARESRLRLIEAGLVDALDATGARDRMSKQSQAAALRSSRSRAAELQRRHAELLRTAFVQRTDDRKRYTGELAPAMEWAYHSDWRLAVELGLRAFAFLKGDGRLVAAGETIESLRAEAVRRGDARVEEECTWELSWIETRAGAMRSFTPAGGAQLAFEF